ncbi:hypothetical protein PanWU01x14_346190, partial [Parasponia andersonii]
NLFHHFSFPVKLKGEPISPLWTTTLYALFTEFLSLRILAFRELSDANRSWSKSS